MQWVNKYLDNSLLGIFEFDKSLNIRSWSEKAGEIFGWNGSAANSKSIKDLNLPDEDSVALLSLLDSLLEGRQNNGKIITHSKLNSGRELCCQLYLSVVEDEAGLPASVVVMADNITDRQAHYEEILRVNERFELIAKATRDNIWDWDMVKNTIWTNDNYLKTFGYNPQNYLHFHEEWASRIHPDDRERCLEIMRTSLEDKSSLSEAEFRFKLADGRYGNILSRSSLLLDQNGQPVRWVGALIDITQRKEAEKKLAESEEKYRQLVDNMAEGIGMQDIDGTIRFLNRRACEMLGYREEELIGKSFQQLFDDVNREIYRQQMILRRNGRGDSYEIEWTCKDGSKLATIINPSPIFNDRNEVVGSSAVFTDITKRKKTEKQLIENERQLAVIYNTVSDVIFMLNIEEDGRFKFISVNYSFLETTGLREDEVVGQYVNQVIPPSSIQAVLEKYNEAIKNKKPVSWEETSEYPSGIKTALVIIAPVIDEEGKCIKLVGSVHDITEGKKVEKEIKERNEQLRQLTSHLQNVREEERAAVAREIHDELGQQLTGLKMDVSWINKKLEPEDEKVRQKIQGLLQLVDGTINTVRRISSDLRPSILDDFGLKEALVWQAAEFEKRTGIHCYFSASVPHELKDKKISITLFRIFQESLTNVARHAYALNVWAQYKSRGNNIELTITDDGIGTDVTLIESKHTMGLMGMKERIRMVDGTLHMVSTPGKGTILRVIVPFSLT